MEREHVDQFLLIAPVWPTQSWYPLLLRTSYRKPILLPQDPQLLHLAHSNKLHPLHDRLQLAAWILSANSCRQVDFRHRLLNSSVPHGPKGLRNSTSLYGRLGVAGVIRGTSIPFRNPNEEELIEFKQFILDKFDDNFDGKISMPELENILPTEENYLAQFRDEFQANKMDSVQFIKIWNHYDSDMSGYLEGDEIDAFLRDMLQQQGCNANTQLIKDFKQFIMDHHDDNKDGKIGLKELSSILPKEENFFAKFQGKPALSRDDFDAVFDHYDADNSGEIDASELLVLLRDVMKKMKLEPDSAQELEKMRDVVLGVSDKNNDGKLSRGELALLLSDVN